MVQPAAPGLAEHSAEKIEIVFEALSVVRRGREVFELMCEGIFAKHLADPYDSRVRWRKIKNPQLLVERRQARSVRLAAAIVFEQASDEMSFWRSSLS
jgi:hypothetical protein